VEKILHCHYKAFQQKALGELLLLKLTEKQLMFLFLEANCIWISSISCVFLSFVCFTRPEFWFTEHLMLLPVDTVLVVPEFASLPVEFPEQLDSTHQTELMILTNWPKVLPGHTIYGS